MSSDNHSESLSKSEQDAAISDTFPARPGAKDLPPAGVSTQAEDPSAAPFVDSDLTNTSQLQGQVPNTREAEDSAKSTLESVRQQVPSTQSISEQAQAGVESVKQQLPSALGVTEQLPSSQGVLNTLSQGLNYVTASIKDLSVGINNATAPKVTTDHAQGRAAEELEVPGKFPGETDDSSSTIGQGPVDSLDELRRNLPAVSSIGPPNDASNVSASDAREHIQSENGLRGNTVTASRQEQLYNINNNQQAPSTHQDPTLGSREPFAERTIGAPQSAANQLPGAQSVKETVDNAADSAYQQLPSTENVKEATTANAQYVADSARSGADSVYQELPSTQEVKEGAQSAASTIQSGAYQAQAQVLHSAQAALGSVQSGLASAKETVSGHQQASENEKIHKEGTDYIKEQVHGANQGQTAPVVPEVVADSRREGCWAPEATASGEVVQEKSEVEKELLSKVGAAPSASEGTATGGFSNNSIGVTSTASGVREDGYWDGKPNSGINTSFATTTTGVGSGLSYPHVGTEQVSSSSKENVEATTGVRNPVTIGGTPIGDVVTSTSAQTSAVDTGSRALPPFSGSGIAGAHHDNSSTDHSYVPGSDPAYPHVGTAQTDSGLPNQSDSIPPVLVPKHDRIGPEPGKGIAPLDHVDSSGSIERVADPSPGLQ